MNRPAVVVGLMVLVGLCLIGLGFEIGRSHVSTTATSTTTTTQAPQSHAGARWWSGVESQVDYISSAETSAYTEWYGLCFPGGGSYCSQSLPSLTRLNDACSSFNPGTTGATKQEIYAMNQLEGACDVYWLEPTNLDTEVFASVSLLASNLESIGDSS